MANNRALQMRKARKMMRCHVQAKMDCATVQTTEAFRGVQDAIVRAVEAIAPYIRELAERIADDFITKAVEQQNEPCKGD